MGTRRGFIAGIRVLFPGMLLMLLPLQELFRGGDDSELPYGNLLGQFGAVFPGLYTAVMMIGVVGGISFVIGAVIYLIKGGDSTNRFQLRLTRRQGHIIRSIAIVIISAILYFNYLLAVARGGVMRGGDPVGLSAVAYLWGSLYQNFPLLYRFALLLIIGLLAGSIFAALFSVDLNHQERRSKARLSRDQQQAGS